MERSMPIADKPQDITPLTVRVLWKYLGYDPFPPTLPDWPPDVFALCAAVLKKSGAYTESVSPYGIAAARTGAPMPRMRRAEDQSKNFRAERIRRAGDAWRQKLGREERRRRLGPNHFSSLSKAAAQKLDRDLEDAWKELGRHWDTIYANAGTKIYQLLGHPPLWTALLELLAVADEACRELGLPSTEPLSPLPGRRTAASVILERERKADWRAFYVLAEDRLFPRQFGSTLCRRIHPSVARVLPKMHTAQCGLTVRSLSLYLAFCESDEVRPSWFSVPGSRGGEDIYRMNILIAPWPLKVDPSQFSAIQHEDVPYRAFDVDIHDTGGEVAEQVASLVTAAEGRVGRIDAVIMPELAVTTRDYRLLRTALLRRKILSVVGIGARQRASNYLAIDVPVSRSFALHLRQRKHHRWKLDEAQINQYHLGSSLRPEKNYWENIDVQDRQLRFIVLRPWLVATALICEDLARHDPVGELIKGIGPNLVIALLMDGPQITKRWSARYAAGLADDPGCSVLSITSLGMAQLSRPRNDDGKSSRVIALWKDAFSGQATEIALDPGDHGVAITVTMRNRAEKTADYRSDGGAASYPTLAGVHSLRLPEGSSRIDQPLEVLGRLSIAEAHELANLAQRPTADTKLPDAMQARFMPDELKRLKGSAFRIGREMWRKKTGGKVPGGEANETWASPEEIEAAEEIINWDATNRMKAN